MKFRNALLIASLLFTVGCSRAAPVVVKGEVFCPRPVRPALVEPRTVEDVLQNWLDTVEYSIALESVVGCYEESQKKKPEVK